MPKTDVCKQPQKRSNSLNRRKLNEIKFAATAGQIFLLCVSLCCISLCHAADAPATPGEIAGGKTSVTIPFRLQKGLIHVDVKLNGKGPLDFFLDCGSSSPTLSPTLAHHIGVAIQGQASGNDEDLREQGGMVAVHRVDLGKAYYFPEPFACFDEPEPNTLGYDVFRRYVVTVDYARQRLTLTRPDHFRYHGQGTIVPCRFFRGFMPVVDGSVDGIPAAFTIDTGNTGYLNFRAAFVENHHLTSRMHTIAVTSYGMARKPLTSLITRLHTVRLGRVALHEMLGNIGRDGVPASQWLGIACNLGTSALKQFTVTFDYRRSRLIFEKNALWGQHDLFTRSGLFVTTRGAVWKVVTVLPHSPADQAGIIAGDTVLTMNSKGHGQLPVSLARGILRGATGARRLSLTLQTATGTKAVVLTLKDDLI